MDSKSINFLFIVCLVSSITECMLTRIIISGIKKQQSSFRSRALSYTCALDNQICVQNNKIEADIWCATKDKNNELFYAEEINKTLQAQRTGYCCHNINVHLSVLGNLPQITECLLIYDPHLVNVYDINGSRPIDLALPSMSALLENYGSPAKSNCPQVIKSFRIPGDGWLPITPLRRACLDGDLDAVMKMIERGRTDNEEIARLREIALVSYWRHPGNDVFLKIACYLRNFYLQKQIVEE